MILVANVRKDLWRLRHRSRARRATGTVLAVGLCLSATVGASAIPEVRASNSGGVHAASLDCIPPSDQMELASDFLLWYIRCADDRFAVQRAASMVLVIQDIGERASATDEFNATGYAAAVARSERSGQRFDVFIARVIQTYPAVVYPNVASEAVKARSGNATAKRLFYASGFDDALAQDAKAAVPVEEEKRRAIAQDIAFVQLLANQSVGFHVQRAAQRALEHEDQVAGVMAFLDGNWLIAVRMDMQRDHYAAADAHTRLVDAATNAIRRSQEALEAAKDMPEGPDRDALVAQADETLLQAREAIAAGQAIWDDYAHKQRLSAGRVYAGVETGRKSDAPYWGTILDQAETVHSELHQRVDDAGRAKGHFGELSTACDGVADELNDVR